MPAIAPEIRRQSEQIKLLCLDVDGVLTDGSLYYDATGEALKRFYTRDAAGMALLHHAGIMIAWISAENSSITAARADKLGIQFVLLGCKNKVQSAERLRKELELEWHEIAYMGDDWFDIDLLESVGFSACPSDAHPDVLKVSAFRSQWPGGNGAVREFCDMLLQARDPNA